MASKNNHINRLLTTAGATTIVIVLIVVATFAFLISNHSVTAAPGTATSTCTVDPRHKKLQDQESNDGTEPWKRQGTSQTTVYFAYGSIPPEYKADVIASAKRWSVSACIEAKAVKSCPKGKNCTTITFKKSGGTNVNGKTRRYFEGKYISEARIALNSVNTKNDAPAKLERLSTIAHEMGHALGLDHRKTPGSLMAGSKNDDYTKPDKIDFQNLRVMYGSQK